MPDTQGPQVSAAAAAPHEQPATREVPSSVVDALVLGAQQLQSLQAHQLKVKGDDAPEAVKPGITTLPKLVAPNPSGGSLEFQDWLELVGGLMSDVSDSSQLWWTSVLQLARDAFARWSVSSPVERMRVAPDDRTEIVEGKWSRVNARACAMLLDSLDASVKADIVARRATQNAAHIMFRLHTIYQPGGTNERDLILRNLHDPPPFKDVVAGVSLLRSWGRWHRRCLECGMVAPDPSILARGLTTVTSQHIARNPDVQFRTQVVRSALHIDLHPSGDEVLDYHKHLLAEFETMAGGVDPKKVDPKVQALNAAAEASGGGNQPLGKGAGGAGGKPCKFFLSPKGCRNGPKCKFPHSMTELSKAERFKKCLVCGSEEHRAKDRPLGKGSKPEAKTHEQPTMRKTTPQASGPGGVGGQDASPPASASSQVPVQATPITMNGQPVTLESFMQEAVKALRQVEVSPGTSEAQPSNSTSQTHPNASLKRLAVLGLGEEKPARSSPETSVLHVQSLEVGDGGELLALVDSGATHAMRAASSQEEWEQATQVVVSLAGENTTSMRLTASGTLLLPPGRDGSAQTIVPMGAIVEQLGYTLMWSAGSCKLLHPDGRKLKLRVRNGCPELVQSKALELISRLEERKLAEIEQLKRHTEEGRDRIRQARIALEKSWWEHLMDYARDGVSCSGDAAVANAPFFTDVPRCALRGLVPSGDAGDESLWDMLRSALPNLNRRRRKALQQSRHWIVHLFAGPRPHKTFARLERDGTVVLELDVTQCAAHDLNRLSLWALLLKAAKDGRIAAVIGGPPCRTMSVLRHKPGGPRPVRSPSEPYGLSDLSASERALVNNDTGLFARMLFSHATATAGRRVHRQSVHHSSQVAFLLEQPQPVDRYLPVGHSLVGEVPSFWHTNLWRAYALEAGLFEVDFDQGALGHATTKPTTIGTNLPDLRGLHGLRKECPTLAWKGDSKDLAAWAPQFVQAVVHALQCWPLYQLCRMTPEDWQRHVENNHVPYRRDCGVCVRGAGTGRRHQGVTHPDVYCLSADVAGPIRVPAKDPEGRSKHPPVFRYFLAASYRFPKLGTKDEPNPTQVDGFDDPLLHPGGEDKLADVVVEGPLEPEHRPDGKDVLPEDCLGYCPTSESENDACKEAGALRVAAAKAKAKPSKPKEEHPWERAKCEFEAPPGLARLVFVVPLHTNKSEAVLEALQQVFLELRSLNLPVLRFHSDRSREFFNKRTRAWFHEHGVRTTTAEGDTPQQNGAAENTIRWLKARARTLLAQAEVGTELWACAMATAASQQRAQQLGLKSKLAAPFGAPCSVKLKFYGPSRGDLGDRWVDGKYMGLSPSVNDGHIVLRNDGVGNGFLQTLHVRSRLHSPEMPDRVFEGDVREPAPLEPARRVRGKSEPALGEPPLPPPPLPPPEGECVPAPASRTRLRGKSSPAVSKSLLFPLPDGECPPEQCEAVEEEFRASRFSVVDLEGFAQELLLEDWDLEEAMWVLVQFSRLQSLKAGLYRHGGVVGTTSATNSHPWLTELMAATLLSASPEAEFTSLWLSNTNPMSLHADHNNVEGSVNVVFPLKLPPEGGDLWVELRAGDVIHGSVEQRVDGTGKKWLGTTHSLQRGKPFYLDPKRRHATTPFEGERVVLVAYTVNTLGKVPESELQALESLGFPLPASARLPLTTQQDVRRLDVFDMFEEGPLELAGEDCPKKVEKGGGWKETQKVEAGTVELEVSWNLKHTPVQHEQTPCGLQTLEPKPHAQVEEESWPEQPVQWELWLPDPQSGQQLCALRSDGLDLRLCKSEPVYTPDIEQLLSGLTEPLQIVHTVDPREAEKHGEVWIPSILSERDRGHRKSCAPFAA